MKLDSTKNLGEISFKCMDFLLFPLFAQLGECLEKGMYFSSKAGLKLETKKEVEGNLGELSEVPAGFQGQFNL